MNEGVRPTQPQLEGKGENIYSLSTASILDQATLQAALLWSIQNHIDVANRSGYNGIELWPQGIRPLRQIRSGNVSEAEKAGVLSTHQSARGANTWSLRELQKVVFLPETIGSVKDLDKVNAVVGDIPVVLFKEVPEGYMQSTPFTTRGIQTDPETATKWGVKNAHEYIEAVQEHGLTNIVIDTHHLRRPDTKTGKPNPLSNWQESIPILLPHTNEIHIGIGRVDYGDMDPEQIKEEAMDLLKGGQQNTELIQMLQLIADKGWNGMVVIEMRPSIYKEVMNRKFFLSGNDLVNIYEKVRNTLYNTLDK